MSEEFLSKNTTDETLRNVGKEWEEKSVKFFQKFFLGDHQLNEAMMKTNDLLNGWCFIWDMYQQRTPYCKKLGISELPMKKLKNPMLMKMQKVWITRRTR